MFEADRFVLGSVLVQPGCGFTLALAETGSLHESRDGQGGRVILRRYL
jgi:hypothetical protein